MSAPIGPGHNPTMAAAELAARIDVPRRLPPRHDGQPLPHLSHSSYSKFLLCPEDWRRHYLLGQRSPATGSMFLGGSVDDALTVYYRRIIDTGDRLTLDQLQDLYRDLWRERLATEEAKRGIRWEPDLDRDTAFGMGLDVLELTYAELLPRIGHPVAVQRRLEYRLTPDLEWTVLCYLDVETVSPDAPEAAPRIVDYKVKGSTVSQAQADADPQPSLYLAGRWLEANPAPEFAFAQIAKPGKRRKTMTAMYVATERTPGQLRGMLARIARAASQIAVCYERFGPDQPWSFADPTHWKCSPRFCEWHAGCPGGAGL